MAKKQKPAPLGPSLADFDEENLLDGVDLTNQAPEEEEEPSEEEEEEEEEEVVPLKKKTKKEEKPPVEKPGKKTTTPPPTPPAEEPEEEEPVEENEEEEEEQEDVSKAFFEKVQSLTGVELAVEYGDIDPLSPQGVALREKALVEKTLDDFMIRLEDEHPEAFQALQYATSGGNIQDLFATERDYSKIVINDDDTEHARQILTEYYRSRGITNESRIKRMIAAEEESEEGIIKAGQGALAELVEEQAADRQQKLAAQQEQLRAQREQDGKFLGAIQELVKGGTISGFKIPTQAEGQQFMQFVKQRLQRDGQGGYLIITPVDPAQLEKQLQTEYFRFKKGDLSSLITTKATTLNAEKLRLRLAAKEDAPRTTTKEKQSARSLKDFEQ